MLRRRQQNQNKGAPRWLVTYSDMVTLILVFFILLFAMSVIDAEKFRAISQSFQERNILDYLPSVIDFENMGEDSGEYPFDVGDFDGQGQVNMDELVQEVQAFLEANALTDVISATKDDRGVVLVLQERILFETGEAEIIADAKPFLDKVGTLLKAIPNTVEVEGHTDSRPISNYRYPSNWELSGARASSVIRYIVENHQLEQNRFIATGFGETRPVVPNTSEENLQLNRRVVIIISDPITADEKIADY